VAALEITAIFERIRAVSPGASLPEVKNGDRFAVVPAAEVRKALELLAGDPALAFDSLMCLAGADNGEFLYVAYFLHSMTHRHRVEIKVPLPRDDPRIASVHDLWRAANFFEREAYDLYGIVFAGHPDLRRILNPEDWEGWPMRKDYVEPKRYHGVKTQREEQFIRE
jgi:NADH-quinone oxidoreductase subunit C